MGPSTPQQDRGLTAVDGAMALIALLLMVQVWLLSATLDAFLAGSRDTAVPGAIVSGLLFLGCGGLYRFVARLERQWRFQDPAIPPLSGRFPDDRDREDPEVRDPANRDQRAGTRKGGGNSDGVKD